MTPAVTTSDHPARERIRTDLATNLLVEAGAGSGKTTSLVGRMLEHVRTGTPVERLAAVTFTRKAANELREKFQVALEQAALGAADTPEEAERYGRAQRELERAFIGTIHAFCARLLREHPLEVGLDPEFTEVTDEAWTELRRQFWRRWIERARHQDDPALAAVYAVGLDAQCLWDGFTTVVGYPDVEFPLRQVPPPDIAACRAEVEALLVAAGALMPAEEPVDGWDKLMTLVRQLRFKRSVSDWSDVAVFCESLERFTESACTPVQRRWSATPGGKAAAKALGERFLAVCNGSVAAVLRQWREHRYPVVMRLLRRAAADFTSERLATGQLSFEDLLLVTAKLLREHPAVREELGARYAHLLVDEFQDTDPIQAEVCLLLASNASEGTDWRRVTPRPGSLFVVGDPKQSIYRFRRADIQVYEAVKQRMAAFGAVLSLTANFRSVKPIESVVNAYFSTAFPPAATSEQAPFSPMETVQPPSAGDGVYRYIVVTESKAKDAIVAEDAAMLASWIAERIASGERRAGDFLILTAGKRAIGAYARALSERNLPVSTTGARLPQEHELNELLIVLRAIADPENAVAVAAALEGLVFGLSPADLYEGHPLKLSITHPPSDLTLPTGKALDQLYRWWIDSQRHPTDVLIERILHDTGLLYHAAGQELGDARAGALLHLVEALRSASLAGANGIVEAMERLELLLAADAPDAPLRPGRTDAVRVMNLHKAKGLEGDVVILAAPVDETEHKPAQHVSRAADGTATAAIAVTWKDGQHTTLLAHPPEWEAMQAAELRFETAEQERLRYVATTRAKRELVVAQLERQRKEATLEDDSLWRPLAGVLEKRAARIDLQVQPAAGRDRVERSAASIAGAVAAADAAVLAASAPSLKVDTVTEGAKQAFDAPDPNLGRARGGGKAWGRAVHRCIEALGSGRRGASLTAFARAVATDEQLDDARSLKLEQLIATVAASAPWQRLLAAGSEPLVELNVAQQVIEDGVAKITEGVIDAAARGADGWLVVDWKSDLVDDAAWAKRLPGYERQVEAYARMLSELTGAPARGVVERVRE